MSCHYMCVSLGLSSLWDSSCQYCVSVVQTPVNTTPELLQLLGHSMIPPELLQALVCLGCLPMPSEGARCQAGVPASHLPVQQTLQNPLRKEAPQPLNDWYVICLSSVTQNPAAANRKEFGGMSSVQCNLNHIFITLQMLPEQRCGPRKAPSISFVPLSCTI